ncbi:MAG: translesion DNA synthesis-associated protein ImuA [Usitatibacter sp.]
MKASIEQLIQLPGVWRGGELEHAQQPAVPTGYPALDAELPGGGWPSGTLSEVLHDGVGIGEVTFLAGALARASEGSRLMAWINPPHLPYAPALAQAGITLDRCLVVRPANREDALWAAEQSLKSGACGAVMLWLDETAARSHDEYAWLRRLQMSAQAGRSMAILFRATAAERLSTPAHLRVVLTREEGVLKARIPKRRGPSMARPIALGTMMPRRNVSFAREKLQAPRPAPAAVPARAFHLVGR